MARKKLIKRKDGRYKVEFRGKCFYGKTPSEANDKRDAYVRLVKAGLQIQQVTVAEYADDWLPKAKAGIREKTYKGYEAIMKRMVESIGKMNLDRVKPMDIKDIYTRHFATFSASHIRHAKNLYTAMFDAALEEGFINRNPCRAKSVKPHKGTEGSHRSITEEEREIIHSVNHKLRPLVTLA